MKQQKKSEDYSTFNIIEFLEEESVPYREHGKNVGQGWIGIDCPFCGGGGFHGGISTEYKTFSCFQCGETASPVKLIHELLNHREWGESYETLRKYLTDKRVVTTTRKIARATSVKLPGTKLTNLGRNYLKSRNYDPDYIIDTYKILETGPGGLYKYRIVIPIIRNGQVVSYTARDFTGKQDPRYRDCPVEKSVVHPKETVYNIDTVIDKVLIVEGPLDVWRMGAETVCLFGVKYTKQQIKLLQRLRLRLAVIMFDHGFKDRSEQLAYELTCFVPNVRIVELYDGDPGEMSDDEAFNLKKEVLL